MTVNLLAAVVFAAAAVAVFVRFGCIDERDDKCDDIRAGGRVVVSRESKPCDKCDGKGKGTQRYTVVACEAVIDDACLRCGGSGVVEATTTYGLEAVAGAWWNETYARRGDLVIDDDRQDGDMPLYRLVAAVALPEETPQ